MRLKYESASQGFPSSLGGGVYRVVPEGEEASERARERDSARERAREIERARE